MVRILPIAGYLALLWMVHASGAYSIMGMEGVWPKEDGMIEGVIAGALLHSDDWHLWGNLSALIPLLIGLAIVDKNPLVTILILVFGAGVLVWVIAAYGSGPHHGASDVVYALVGFLTVYGFRSGNIASMGIAIIVLLMFGGATLAAIVPDGSGMSWEGHLAGLIVGAVWGLVKPKDTA